MGYFLFLILASLTVINGFEFGVPTVSETLKHLNTIEKIDFKKLISAIPHIFKEQLSNMPLSSQCLAGFQDAMNNFLGDNSIFMLIKNTGKNINELGDYKTCKKDGARFYIFAYQIVRVGLCVPRNCQYDDMVFLRKLIVDTINKMFPDINLKETDLTISDVETLNDKHPTNETYIFIAILGGILLVSIICAFIDNSIPADKWNSSSRKALESFNIYKNALSLFFSENRVDKNLDILNGVKILSMGWIMFGHMLMQMMMVPIYNILELENLFLDKRSYALYTGASLAVDVFFCLMGFLGILVTTEQLKNPKQNKILAIILIYIHRYIRMLPVYAISILVPMYILPYLGNGPLFFEADQIQGECKTKWYWNLLYVNNLGYDENYNCLGWSWYIANDFQMYLLVPILVCLYSYKQLYAYMSVAVLMLGSIGAQLLTFIHYDISANIAESAGATHFMSKYYTKPWCRINPFLIGILAAWLYISYKKYQKSPPSEENPISFTDRIVMKINDNILNAKWLRYMMYFIGFSLMFYFVYGYFDFYKKGSDKSKPEQYTFLIASRPLFVFGLLLIVYPGCLGKCRVLREILSHEVFNVLSKTVFAGYMFNMEVTAFYWASKEDGFYVYHLSMWTTAIELVTVTFALGTIITLIYEYPIIGLSKEFLRPKREAIAQKLKPEMKKDESETKGILMSENENKGKKETE